MNEQLRIGLLSCCLLFVFGSQASAQLADPVHITTVGKGWARNSINAVVFRQSSVTSFGEWQYTAYYAPDGTMVLAKRTYGSNQWTTHKSHYKADVRDAHNSISIAVDGDGFLHVSWGMHGQELNYARSQKPGGLELTERLSMTGEYEHAVTYPRFYRLPGGDLLFMYRDGSSGKGNVMLNRYDIESKTWRVVQHPLIDGEGERNAYTNGLVVDQEGNWHISWTWRETWDVSTNHDILYAWSPDEGETWMRSDGEAYQMPINEANAEVVCRVPRGSELINQTSMTVNSQGEPVIATYWKAESDNAPQYSVVWKDGDQWTREQVGDRNLDFSLSGGGTKRIPMSRPQVVAGERGELYYIFRDFEQGEGITIAVSEGTSYGNWRMHNIYKPSVGLWEPSLDRQRWRSDYELNLFVQKVEQGDGEQTENIPPQAVKILEWIPEAYRK